MWSVVCKVWTNVFFFFQLQQFRFQDNFGISTSTSQSKRLQRSHSFRWEQRKTFSTGKPWESHQPAGVNLHRHKCLCEHFFFYEASRGKNVPAGNPPLTSRGQRACPSAAPPAAWGRSPAARRADVRRGWPGGWRRAARGSPAKTGSDFRMGVGRCGWGGGLRCFCYFLKYLFPSCAWKNLLLRCTFHSRVVFSAIQSGCCATGLHDGGM